MSDERAVDEADPLAEAVFRRAFPEAGGDETLDLARMCVIRGKTGSLPPEWRSKGSKLYSLRSLEGSGFDPKMRSILAARPTEELVLFVTHSGAVFTDDLARRASIPRELAGDEFPRHADTFNRSLHRLEQDLKAIDVAFEAVTGRPPPGPRSR